MSDLIDRQAAIDAFWKLDIELKPSAIDAITDMLKKLPSAQPEMKVLRVPYTGKPIDIFDSLTEEEKQQNRWYAEGFGDAMKELSAQTERKKGKWIHHTDWERDGECGYECSVCGMGSDVDYDFFMRCGADMRTSE